MTIYRSQGFRSVTANSHQEAAEIFATRMAKREYGPRGHCRSIRLDCRTEDGRDYTFEAFIGRPVPGENATSGRNRWIYTHRVGIEMQK